MNKEVTKYQGNFIKVSEMEIEGAIWEKVYLQNGVIVFAFTEEGKCLLIKEKRPHETPPYRLKFVTGLMDKPDEDPLETANRELQEEVGYKAENLEVIIHRKSTGTINNNVYLVLAQNLLKSKIPNPEGEDTIMEICEFSIEEIMDLLSQGKLPWDQAILGIFKIKQEGLI